MSTKETRERQEERTWRSHHHRRIRMFSSLVLKMYSQKSELFFCEHSIAAIRSICPLSDCCRSVAPKIKLLGGKRREEKRFRSRCVVDACCHKKEERDSFTHRYNIYICAQKTYTHAHSRTHNTHARAQ